MGRATRWRKRAQMQWLALVALVAYMVRHVNDPGRSTHPHHRPPREWRG